MDTAAGGGEGRDNMSYQLFTRSCTDWKSFARARKMKQGVVGTEQEALDKCESFNKGRTAAQIRRGTKMEWTKI